MALAGQVAIAYFLDLLLGDPARITHPVTVMGRVISGLERIFRPFCHTARSERLAGTVLAVAVTGGAYAATAVALRLAGWLHPYLGIALSAWLISTTIAVRGLAEAAMEISRWLGRGDLKEARRALARVVGRDTESLEEPEIVRGAVETVAENTTDGVVAPLFYALLGGAPLAMAYRAINTLDSMVGYRDERYLHLGWASARLDDLANYLPARVTGLLLVAAAALLGLDWNRAWRTWRSDAARHPSPNSGIPEAVMAGALGVRLGGLNYYRGKPSFRAYLGTPEKPLEPPIIKDAVGLMYLASFLAVTAGLAIRRGLS